MYAVVHGARVPIIEYDHNADRFVLRSLPLDLTTAQRATISESARRRGAAMAAT